MFKIESLELDLTDVGTAHRGIGWLQRHAGDSTLARGMVSMGSSGNPVQFVGRYAL